MRLAWFALAIPFLGACTAAADGSGDRDDDDEATASAEVISDPLTFRTSLIADFSACTPGRACADADKDGLNDVWEDAVLARFRPLLEFDEQEKGLTDPKFRMGIAGRVVPRPNEPSRVVVFFAFAYSEDYGSCSFTEHHGDIERAAIEIERIPGKNGDAKIVKAFTAAHEGDWTDKSRRFEGAALTRDLEFVGGRWLLYPSRNKHGTYASKKACESTKLFCLADYCSAENMESREAYRRLLPVLNAGEPDAPRESNWASFGYPDTDAWSDQAFCGTSPANDAGGDCDSAPRKSLIADPFTRKDLL